MREKTPTVEDVFVNLLAASNEDPKIRKFLIAVVSLDDFERNSLVNTFITEMSLKGAPAEFIRAVAALRDATLSQEVKKWLDAGPLP